MDINININKKQIEILNQDLSFYSRLKSCIGLLLKSDMIFSFKELNISDKDWEMSDVQYSERFI